MKIKETYPQEKNWQAWITFSSGEQINRVFLWRLAAYCRDVVKARCTITVGLRSYAEQQRLYELYVAGRGNIAARPGKSRHNFGLAVDFNRISTVNGQGVYPGTLNADYAAWKSGRPEEINKYGLRHSVDTEPWHVEPIETRGVGIDDIAWFSDKDDFVNTPTGYPTIRETTPRMRGQAIKYLQQLLGVAPADGVFGPASAGAASEYQRKNKLTVDGIVGTGTWQSILPKAAPVAPPQPTKEQLLQEQLDDALYENKELKEELADLRVIIDKKITDQKALEEQKAALTSKLETADMRLTEQANTIRNLRENNTTQIKTIAELREELDGVQKSFEAVLADKNSLMDDLEKAKDNTKYIEGIYNNEIQTLNEENIRLQKIVDEFDEIPIVSRVIDWKDATPGEMISQAIRVFLKLDK